MNISDIQIINPLTYPGWDELLLATDGYSFFHSASWARVLHESYKYRPLYFTCIENGKLSALIPMMEVISFLTGRRGVSLPFTDCCHPIVQHKEQFKKIRESIIGLGKRARWKYIEFRGGKDFLQNQTASMFYYEHILDLTPHEPELLSTFRKSTTRNVKKAQKLGLGVKICNSLESMKEFYRLNCMTRKNHGLPPQPFHFFRKVYEYIISKNLGLVVLASHQNRNIAGAVFFHLGEKVLYKYGASDESHKHLRPNNLVMWEAIKWYAQHGFKTLSLGRTEPENEGLLQFKRGWGTRQETISYYRYDLAKDCYLAEKPGIKSSYNFFKMIPLPVLRFTGNLLYRHVG